MNRWRFTISEENRAEVTALIVDALARAPAGWVFGVFGPTRTLLQNKKLWPMLTDIADQARWDGDKMVQEEWKDFFTAGLRQARMVRGLERRTVVFVGMGTSELTREEFADLIELMYHFGAEHKVRWSEKSLEAIAAMRSTEEEK